MRYAKIYLLNNIPPIIKKVRNFDPHFDPHPPKKSQENKSSFTETDEGALLVIQNYDL